jgi:hypothetical protein
MEHRTQFLDPGRSMIVEILASAAAAGPSAVPPFLAEAARVAAGAVAKGMGREL